MAKSAATRRRTTWLVVAALLLFMALVVYRSFHIASYKCVVCVSFEGRRACGNVEGQTESEARAGAMTNACAQVASGVTETMACERTQPSQSDCAAIN